MKAIIKSNKVILTQLPNSFKGVENVEFGYIGRTDLHALDGFYQYIKKPLTKYKKYGGLSINDCDSNTMICTHPILDFSTNDIEAYEENLVDDKLNQYQNDGVEFLRIFRNFVYRKYKGGEITENQFKGIRSTLAPALLPLKVGAWDLAQDLVDDITEPNNANMKALLNKVKDKIDTYITDNY